MKKIPKPVVVYTLLVLYTLAPLLCVLLSAGIASHFNCRSDESGAHPCWVGGHDIGEILVGLFVTGWLMLVTLPTGTIAVSVYSIWLLSRRAKRNGPP